VQLRGLRTEALLAPGQLENVPPGIAALESLLVGNSAADAHFGELRQWAAAQAAIGSSAGTRSAAEPPRAAEGGETEQPDAEDDALMGQYDDLEACAEELAAQCATSSGGTAEAKKKMVVALEAIKAGKKKKKGGLVVQQQRK
jgi:hypothetical protein